MLRQWGWAGLMLCIQLAHAQIDCQSFQPTTDQIDHQEHLLLMQSLKRAWRDQDSLVIQIGKKRYTLNDQCTPTQAVSYRLIDIQHAIEHWVVAEYTPHRTRYLILRPDIDQQMVVNTPPSFSPDLMYMVVFDSTVEQQIYATKLSIWRIGMVGWSQQISQQRLQDCTGCPDQLLQHPIDWDNNRRFSVHPMKSFASHLQIATGQINEQGEWQIRWQPSM